MQSPNHPWIDEAIRNGRKLRTSSLRLRLLGPGEIAFKKLDRGDGVPDEPPECIAERKAEDIEKRLELWNSMQSLRKAEKCLGVQKAPARLPTVDSLRVGLKKVTGRSLAFEGTVQKFWEWLDKSNLFLSPDSINRWWDFVGKYDLTKRNIQQVVCHITEDEMILELVGPGWAKK